MSKKYAALIGGILSLSMVQAASAMPTEFDFTAGNLGVTAGNAYNSVGMTVDGIGLNITAYTIVNDGSGDISSLTQVTGVEPGSSDEIGVYVSSMKNLGVYLGGSDSHSMDGGSGSADPGDLDEGLLFSFDQKVTLTYINFDNFGHSDDFNLTLFEDPLVSKLVDYDSHDGAKSFVSPVSGEHDEYEFDLTGTDFLFWVDGDSDSVRVDYIKVKAAQAVPAPAPLFLMGAGLLGLAYRRRQRGA